MARPKVSRSMKKLILPLMVFVLAFAFAGTGSCVASGKHSHSIRLRWVKAYPGEQWKDVETGLLWSLSFLGAELPPGDSLIVREDSAVFMLDLDRAGFSAAAIEALVPVLDSLKNSQEYETKGAIDLGRFVMVTEGSSWNYYAITGVPATYREFLRLHPQTRPVEFHLRVSSVADHQRLIRYTPAKDYSSIAFIAEEGEGSPDSGSFRLNAYEVFDLMPNGQLRFAVYDAEGKLLAGSPQAIGKAGKPGKCLWCHELNVQKLFVDSPEPEKGISIGDFIREVDHTQQLIEDYRKTLSTRIHFQNRQDHTYSELLYISFMEPSAFRLANDWGMNEAEVIRKFNRPTHVYAEFPFLGYLWYRSFADSLAPYRGLAVPFSMRDPSPFEPVYHANPNYRP
jgi:hypothetical protein